MFKRLTDERVTVSLPKTFNMSSMRQFIRDAIHMQAVTGAKRIVFDFSQMSFIEPEGVVVLANTIEFFRQTHVEVRFAGHSHAGPGRKYLDDSGFFEHYLKRRLFVGSELRPRSRLNYFLQATLSPISTER